MSFMNTFKDQLVRAFAYMKEENFRTKCTDFYTQNL